MTRPVYRRVVATEAAALEAAKRPINREQLIERFRKAQADAAALGLNYAQYRPEDMSDADMIRVGTEIKEAIAMETTTTPAR